MPPVLTVFNTSREAASLPLNDCSFQHKDKTGKLKSDFAGNYRGFTQLGFKKKR